MKDDKKLILIFLVLSAIIFFGKYYEIIFLPTRNTKERKKFSFSIKKAVLLTSSVVFGFFIFIDVFDNLFLNEEDRLLLKIITKIRNRINGSSTHNIYINESKFQEEIDYLKMEDIKNN